MAAKTSAPSAMASSSVSGASIVNAAHALPPAPSGSLGTGVAAGPNANSSSTSGGGGGSGSNAAGTSVSSGIAQLVTPHARDTSLAPNRQVDASAIDYLTTEMTYTLQESAQVAAKRLLRHREELREAGFPIQSSSSLPPGGADSSSANGAQRSVSQAPAILAANASRRFSSLSLHNGPSEEEVDVELTARLELIGYHVGANMSERLSSLRPPHGTILDVLKFVCKDVWTAIWEKQVDNLRTNHRGVYVLQDNHFKPLRRMSTARGATDTAKEARPHLSFATGIVRGALARMGVSSTVTAEILAPPAPSSSATSGAAAGTSSAAAPSIITACTFSVKTASGR